MSMANTIQTGIKSHEKDSLTNYALFLGGTNVIHDVLAAYDPLKTGYGRLFMVKKPVWLDTYFGKTNGTKNKLDKFKHILEYGNTAVQGLNDVTVEFQSIQGGYVGKSFEIPTYASDSTNSFSVNVYEFSGSPVREVIHTWINGTTDLLTGLATYNGESDIERIQANQTAEFVYVATDNTGENVEYACLLANCFPRGIKTDQFNYTSGEHQLVETNIEFTCTKYESIQINKVANALINKYRILANSLNFYSGYTTGTETRNGIEHYTVGKNDENLAYDVMTGTLSKDAWVAGTNILKPLNENELA